MTTVSQCLGDLARFFPVETRDIRPHRDKHGRPTWSGIDDVEAFRARSIGRPFDAIPELVEVRGVDRDRFYMLLLDAADVGWCEGSLARAPHEIPHALLAERSRRPLVRFGSDAGRPHDGQRRDDYPLVERLGKAGNCEESAVYALQSAIVDWFHARPLWSSALGFVRYRDRFRALGIVDERGELVLTFREDGAEVCLGGDCLAAAGLRGDCPGLAARSTQW